MVSTGALDSLYQSRPRTVAFSKVEAQLAAEDGLQGARGPGHIPAQVWLGGYLAHKKQRLLRTLQ